MGNNNKLTSLEGAPTHIGGSCWCDDKLPLMRFLMTSVITKTLHKEMRCAAIVNPHLKDRPLTRAEILKLQQELIDAGFEEEARL